MSSKPLGQVANYKPLRDCGMEELAAYVRSFSPERGRAGGIAFARNADADGKRQARQTILDLFSGEVWPGPLNMLTMPGVNWRFERLLLGQREPGWFGSRHPRRTHFTGVENDRSIYFAGLTQMPGIETPGRLIRPVKRARFPFAETALKTRYAAFFFANVDDVLTHVWGQAHREPTHLGWDAAWLDYTGPLTIERLRRIAEFHTLYVRRILIVTALKARWDRKTSRAIEVAGGHSAWLRANLSGEVIHDIEYFDTSPMAQFAIRKGTPGG